jgi:hypothetical protein
VSERTLSAWWLVGWVWLVVFPIASGSQPADGPQDRLRTGEVSPAEICYGLTSAIPGEQSGMLRPGRITGSTTAEFSMVLPGICQRNPATCRGLPHSHTRPGDLVAVGQAVSGFVCAHYSDGRSETDGWLASDQVRIEDPKQLALPLASWNGTWHAVTQAATITIQPIDNESLHLEGEASWPSATDEGRHVGYIDATGMPNGSMMALTEEADGTACRMSLLLLDHMLVAVDNQACGGMNVRFAGYYVLDRKR